MRLESERDFDMRIVGWFFISILVLLNTTGCARILGVPGAVRDGKYDFSTVLFNGGLEKIYSDWPRIHASATQVFIRGEEKERVTEEANSRGRAIIIPPYVLVLYHIVDFRKQTVTTPIGRFEIDADEVIEEKYWLEESPNGKKIPLEKVKIFDDPKDLILLKFSTGEKITHPVFTFGKSAELKRGHIMFVLSSPNLALSSVKKGIVSGFGSDFSENSKQVEPNYTDLISTDAALAFGDSGSPVVAIRDGLPELVGVAKGKVKDGGIGILISIDSIVEAVRSETGIDLRKLNEENLSKR